MTVEIYSIGDAQYLTTVLNGVAALGGAGKYQAIASLSLLIGMLLVAFQAVMSGGKEMNLQFFVVAVVMVNVTFNVRTNVIVHDVYRGAAYNVNNVPWGLAFPGGLLSQIGYNTTQFMEQAFSTPEMSQSGFGGAVALMLNARRIDGFGKANYGCTNPVSATATPDSTDMLCSVEGTLYNYVRDCVGTGITVGQLNMDDIKNAPYALDRMRTNLGAFTTSVTIGFSPQPDVSGNPSIPAGGWSVTCTEAYDLLVERMQNPTFISTFNRHASARLGTDNADMEISNVLSRFGTSLSSAQHFMLNQAMRASLENGMGAFLSMQDRQTAAAMMTQASHQRNIQWAGEASLFARYIRPMMTFFEAFIYAMAPFIVFLLGLGPMGMKLALKYFQLPLWVNLWMPVMAIINLYVNTIAQRRLVSFQSLEGIDPTSIAGSITMFTSFQDWLGTASMLASSVPAITGMLLFGGAVAMSSLSSRLQSGDYVDEKLAAPPVAQNSAALQVKSFATSSPSLGTNITDSEQGLPQVNIANGLQAAAQSQKSEAAAWQTSLGKTMNSVFSASHVKNMSTSELASVGQQLVGSHDNGLRTAASGMVSQLMQQNMSREQALATTAATFLEASGSAGAGAGLGASGSMSRGGTNDNATVTSLPGAGSGTAGGGGGNTNNLSTQRAGTQSRASLSGEGRLHAGVDGKGGARFTDEERMGQKQAIQDGLNLMRGLNAENTIGGSLAARATNGLDRSALTQFTKSLSKQDAQAFADVASRSQEERQQYLTTEAASAQFGVSNSIGAQSFGAMAAANREAMSFIDGKLGRNGGFGAANPELAAEVKKLEETMLSDRSGYSKVMDADQRRAIAFMQANSNLAALAGPGKGEQYLNNVADLSAKMGFASAAVDPNRFQDRDDLARAPASDLAARVERAASEADKATPDRNPAPGIASTVDRGIRDGQQWKDMAVQGVANVSTSPTVMARQGEEAALRAGSMVARELKQPTLTTLENTVQAGEHQFTNNTPEGANAFGLMNRLGAKLSDAFTFNDDNKIQDQAQREEAKQALMSGMKNVPQSVKELVAEKMLNPDILKGDANVAQDQRVYRDAFIADTFAARENGMPARYQDLSPADQKRADQFAEGAQQTVDEAAKSGIKGLPAVSNLLAYHQTIRTDTVERSLPSTVTEGGQPSADQPAEGTPRIRLPYSAPRNQQ